MSSQLSSPYFLKDGPCRSGPEDSLGQWLHSPGRDALTKAAAVLGSMSIQIMIPSSSVRKESKFFSEIVSSDWVANNFAKSFTSVFKSEKHPLIQVMFCSVLFLCGCHMNGIIGLQRGIWKLGGVGSTPESEAEGPLGPRGLLPARDNMVMPILINK